MISPDKDVRCGREKLDRDISGKVALNHHIGKREAEMPKIMYSYFKDTTLYVAVEGGHAGVAAVLRKHVGE